MSSNELLEQCDNCCSFNVVLTKAMFYFCTDCKASVGCHKETLKPFGRMADKETRELRKLAHSEFDKLWFTGLIDRSKAYEWLASQLQIEVSLCHISMLTKVQLLKAIEVTREYLDKNKTALERRKAKKDARREKQRQREHKRTKVARFT